MTPPGKTQSSYPARRCLAACARAWARRRGPLSVRPAWAFARTRPDETRPPRCAVRLRPVASAGPAATRPSPRTWPINSRISRSANPVPGIPEFGIPRRMTRYSASSSGAFRNVARASDGPLPPSPRSPWHTAHCARNRFSPVGAANSGTTAMNHASHPRRIRQSVPATAPPFGT